jgi:hypothetical protein
MMMIKIISHKEKKEEDIYIMKKIAKKSKKNLPLIMVTKEESEDIEE